MPRVIGQLPSEEEARIIRSQIKQHDAENPEAFLPADVDRLMREDYYLARYFMHSVEDPGDDQVECAVKRIKKSFEWRKTENPAAIKPEHLNPILKELGCLFTKGFDVDGKPILVMAIRNHPGNLATRDEYKTFFHFFLEKIERETFDGMSTVLFECEGAGLKHFDVEMVQYLISTFKNWYPYALNYILVFDMPWVLNAAWKLVKGWLPPAGQQKTKFVSKSTIVEYLPPDQHLSRWGGPIDWEYSFEDMLIPLAKKVIIDPAKSSAQFSTPVKVVSSHEDFGSVHSLDAVDSSSKPLTEAGATVNGAHQAVVGLLSINPSDEVVFEALGTGNNVNLVASVVLKNVSPEKRVAFKIKTTNPEKYKVRPCLVALNVGEACEVKIVASSAHLVFDPDVVDSTGKQAFTEETVRSILKDKFLVTATTLKDGGTGASDEKPSYSELTELMRTSVPESQYRLRCRIADFRVPAGNLKLQEKAMPSSTSSTLASANKQLESLINKVSRLDLSNNELQESVSSMKKLVLLLLLVIIGLQILVYSQLPGSGVCQEGMRGKMSEEL